MGRDASLIDEKKPRPSPEGRNKGQGIAEAPCRWWQVMASEDTANLPFSAFFAHMIEPMPLAKGVRRRANDLRYAPGNRPVPPPLPAEQAAHEARRLARRVTLKFSKPAPPNVWGDDSRLIEGWFEAGEQLQHAELGEGGYAEYGSLAAVSIFDDQPPRTLDRALSWMRSLALSR